jgi:hypothetical protein
MQQNFNVRTNALPKPMAVRKENATLILPVPGSLNLTFWKVKCLIEKKVIGVFLHTTCFVLVQLPAMMIWNGLSQTFVARLHASKLTSPSLSRPYVANGSQSFRTKYVNNAHAYIASDT